MGEYIFKSVWHDGKNLQSMGRMKTPRGNRPGAADADDTTKQRICIAVAVYQMLVTATYFGKVMVWCVWYSLMQNRAADIKCAESDVTLWVWRFIQHVPSCIFLIMYLITQLLVNLQGLVGAGGLGGGMLPRWVCCVLTFLIFLGLISDRGVMFRHTCLTHGSVRFRPSVTIITFLIPILHEAQTGTCTPWLSSRFFNIPDLVCLSQMASGLVLTIVCLGIHVILMLTQTGAKYDAGILADRIRSVVSQ